MTETEISFVQAVIERIKSQYEAGEVANYIPELAKASPKTLGITIQKLGKEPYSLGDCDHTFTLQSISKVFTLFLALADQGEEKLFEKVGMEPTGENFNSMAKLEQVDPVKPFNPMINAGAIVVTSLIKGEDADHKFKRILSLIRTVANDETIDYNKAVYQSEIETADLNRSLGYYLKQNKAIQGDVDEHISVYSKHCSIEVSCKNLARMALVLANQGIDPVTGEQIIPRRHVQIASVFMTTCGMYNASGEFAVRVGIPAKSGVSGGVMAIVPGKMGIGIIGPALSKKGNSIAGVELLKYVSNEWELSMF